MSAQQDLRLACWNVNGWSVKRSCDPGREIRQTIIDFLNYDIIALCETHLVGEEVISQSGYVWLGNNRKKLSTTTVKGSGGVGFLVKQLICQIYDIKLLDSTQDDILWIKLIDKSDPESSVYLCACYLPPAGSSQGDQSQRFYDLLLSQVYQYYDDSPLIILGDVNGRIGDLQDFHVVDYMMTPFSQVTSVSNFQVQSVSELLKKIDIRPGTAKIPDHSVLTCVLNLSCYETLQNETDATNKETETLSYNDQPT